MLRHRLCNELLAAMLAACLATPPAMAAPPAGKGKPDGAHGKNVGGAPVPGKPDKGSHPATDGGPAPREQDRSGRHETHQGHATGGHGDAPLVRISIGYGEARRIAVEHRHTGYSALPPGIRKNLARGKPLPPGIAKKVVPAPVLARLPVYPGYEWRIYGSDLVLVALATAIVADVLFGVFE